jgi:AAA family ATPase
VFPGMIFKGISLRGPRRTFTVVTCGSSGQGRFEESTIVSIVGRDSAPSQSFRPSGVQHRLEVTNIAGIDQALKKLNGFLRDFDREFEYTECKRSCAALLHGGNGTGKTFILNKIAKTGWGKVYKIGRGAKEATIRTAFKDAKVSQPSIILIDDIERIVAKEDSVSQDITDALGEELDSLIEDHPANSLPRVLVVAATREPSSIPMSLKKRGRFKTDIALPVPDAADRKSILKSMAPRLNPDVMNEVLDRLGDRTHAYTAEDLASLLDTAYGIAEEKVYKLKDDGDTKYYLTEEDIETALAVVRPTAMHDITLKPPSVRWNQIGGQDSVKKALRRAVEIPLLVSICRFLLQNFTDRR